MSEESEQLSVDFLRELFKASLNNKNILEIMLNYVKTNFLPEETWKKLFTEIKNQYKVDKKMPTIGSLKIAFRTEKERDMRILIDEIKETDAFEYDTILHTLELFIKQSKFVELHDDCGDLYNRGKRKEALSLFMKGADEFNHLNLNNQTFETVFGDFEKRQQERLDHNNKQNITKIPFGIDELDIKTNGGAETTEYVLFLADAKAGKSFLAVHLGMNAARRGIGVVHFQLEGTKKQCLDRYDAAWSGVLYHDIKKGEFPAEKYKSYQKIIQNLGKTDIHVDAPEKFLATSMIDIRRKVIDLKKDFDIKLVLIDYLELTTPDHTLRFTPSEERNRQQMISRQMKDLAVEQNVLVCSFTQASSIKKEQLDDPDWVITREHLSEDKGKVRPVDMLITLNATTAERKDHIMRLYTDGLREYSGGDTMYIKTSFKNGRFYDRLATLEAFPFESI